MDHNIRTNFIHKVKEHLDDLQVQGYLTYLSQIAQDQIDKISKKDILRKMLVETLLHNKHLILKGEQVLSDGLWAFMKGNGWVTNYTEKQLKSLASHELKHHQPKGRYLDKEKLFGLKMSEWGAHYRDAESKDLVNEMFTVASGGPYIGISTSAGKFGYRSTLGLLTSAERIIHGWTESDKSKNRTIMKDSSYRGFLRYSMVSSEGLALLENMRIHQNLALGIRVSKDLI